MLLPCCSLAMDVSSGSTILAVSKYATILFFFCTISHDCWLDLILNDTFSRILAPKMKVEYCKLHPVYVSIHTLSYICEQRSPSIHSINTIRFGDRLMAVVPNRWKSHLSTSNTPTVDHSGRVVLGMNCLCPLEHWGHGFKSHWRHGC
jgi:hypothetical protein